MDPVFITGNQHKADHLARLLGRPVRHHKVDLDEIQSLDLREVAAHKARQAYDILKEPTLVEDVALTFTAMGRLPGTLVKWFLAEIGTEGLCRIADNLQHRGATASTCYVLYDGKQMHYFDAHVEGSVSAEPRGERGFGWDPVFIPSGSTKTYAEMTLDETKPFSVRSRAVEKLRAYLDQRV
jgi:non-canonical purine NTP pyrophosphatase (RdgB/HAM1 family)